MTSHFTPEQFVDALETPLSPEQQAHLAVCVDCTNELAGMRLLMGDVTLAGAVPEPSPLFWNHLSARVRDAVDAEPVPTTPWWGGWRPIASWAAVIGVVALAVALQPKPTPAGFAPAGMAIGADALTANVETSEVWDLIAVAAPSMSTDTVYGSVLQPAASATDAAIESLTNAQRQELVKLMRAEMNMGEHE